MTLGSQQPILNMFAQAFKGKVSQKINVVSYSTCTNKGQHFAFFFFSRSHFFEPKIRIAQRNLNQNCNYFNPLVSGAGRFEETKMEVKNLVGLSL